MNHPVRRGIDCQVLDAAVETDKRLASEAILKARLLQDQQHPDEAAREYAHAAGVELRLAETCEARGLSDKSWVHRFGALRSKDLAGDIHDAIALGEESLARSDVPAALRQRLREYVELLRIRRAQWSADLTHANGVSQT